MSTLEYASATEISGGELPGATEGHDERAADRREERAADTTSFDPTETERSEGPSVLSKDAIFGVLTNRRRRRAIDYLRKNPTTTISDLAEHVAALENDKAVREVSSTERKRVYVALYQCHLPKMDDADVIDYDQARGTVETLETTGQLFPYLDLDPGEGVTGEKTRGWPIFGWLSSLASLR